MNFRFKISLAANVILALLVLWLARARSDAVREAPAAVQIASSQPEAQPTARQPEVVASTPSTFRWSQLESSDYRTFIQNLRESGCPETTIRAIVTADTDGAFAFKRRLLHLDETQTGPWSRQTENQLIASLMGDQLAAENPLPARQNSRTFVRSEPAPALPLVFQASYLDPAQLDLTEVQKQVIGQLQQQFLDEIGDDTNDPTYLARWQAAQPKIDQSLRGLLGSQFYLQLQRQAANGSASP